MSKVAPLGLGLPLEVSTEHCGSLVQSNISSFNPMFDSSVIYVTFGAPIDTPRFCSQRSLYGPWGVAKCPC